MMKRGPLETLIAEEIRAHGPISFARFMERALLEPAIGYYASQQVRAGRSGDFMTAPELHPLLGAAIARLAEETWRRIGCPQPFRWIEFGAGSGALLLAALAHLEREDSPLLAALEIEAIEANPFRRAELEASVAALPQHARPRLVQRDTTARGEIAGIVVANEFLDALPFHIVVGRTAAPRGFLERCVGLDASSGELTWVEAEPDAAYEHSLTARVQAHTAAAATLAEGQLAEFSLAADAWVATLPSYLDRGVALVIDYGRESGALRDAATRMAGTALAYSEHRATSDLLSDPGGRDLTAHVDLTALRVAATAAGLGHIASTTQAGLLAAAGIDGELQRLRSGPDATLEGALALRTALASLMDPRGMGGFAVELFTAGSPSDRMALSNPADPLPGTAAPIRRLV